MLDLQSEEERRIREIVERRPLPRFFDGYDIEFGQDWSGDPSVTIWLEVDVRLATNADENDAVNLYVRETEHELVGLRLSHWPFIRFRVGARDQPVSAGQ